MEAAELSKSREVWDLIEHLRGLARIEVQDLRKYGIISPPFYYELEREREMPSFELACYLALAFFSVFLNRPLESLNDEERAFRKKHSAEIVADMALAFGRDFCVRAGKDALPIEKPVLRRSKSVLDPTLINNLLKHENGGKHSGVGWKLLFELNQTINARSSESKK